MTGCAPRCTNPSDGLRAGLRAEMDSRFGEVDSRFTEMSSRFAEMSGRINMLTMAMIVSWVALVALVIGLYFK